MRIRSGLAAWFVGATVVLAGTAAEAAPIKVLGNESMPFDGMVDGKPAGMAVDILNAVTADGGPAFEFDLSLPWARAQAVVHEQPGTAIIPFTRTAEREPKYHWIAELFDYHCRLVTYGRPAPLRSIDEAKGLTITVPRGSPFIPMLTQLGMPIEEGKDDTVNVHKLLAGHVGAWAVAEYVGQYLYVQAGGDPAAMQMGPTLGEASHIFIAADPSFPEADAKAIADGVARLRASGKLDAILAKYKN